MKEVVKTDSALMRSELLASTLQSLTPVISDHVDFDAIVLFDVSDEIKPLLIVEALRHSLSEKQLAQINEQIQRVYSDLLGEQVVFPDVTTHENCPGREVLAVDAFQSIIFEPVLNQGHLSGVLALAAAETDVFKDSHARILKHHAHVFSNLTQRLGTIQDTAWRDTLTGIYNRRGMEIELHRLWLESRQNGHELGVALCDLDQFKAINDEFGHLMGDRLLQEFVALMTSVARRSDVVTRYGGDEFLVILPHSGPTNSLAFAERLRERVQSHVFCKGESRGLKLTTSIGLAGSDQHKADDTIEAMLERADNRLLTAKRQGRNRVCLQHAKNKIAWGTPLDDEAGVGEVNDDRKDAGTVLIVDDEASVLKALSLMLAGQGIEVLTATSGKEALEIVDRDVHAVDLVVTDLNMPVMSGLELMEALRVRNDAIMTIVVTGVSSTDNAVDALRRGAYDFITKPIIMDAFISAVKRGLEISRLRKENMVYQQNLEQLVQAKSHALNQALSELESAQMFILEALVSLLDAREHSTGQHSLRVCEVTVLLACALGYSDLEVEEFAQGALLHDIGKVAIPDSILLKPGKLTKEEQRIMETHAEVGYQLLAGCPHLKKAADIVHEHQEKYDGTGFPQGLKGQEICDGARLFAVIDAYDAMRSDRVYRKGLCREKAVEQIAEGKATQFDPHVVDAFLNNVDEIERIGRWEDEASDESSSSPENVLEIVKQAKAARSVNERRG